MESCGYRQRTIGGTRARAGGLRVRWRTIEWLGAGLALFLQSGAIFPLLLAGAGGATDDAVRAKLRLVALPAYLITAVLLSRHPRPLLIAMRRNLLFNLLLILPFLSVFWSVSPSITVRRAVALLCSISLAYLLAIRFTPRQLALLLAAVLAPCMVLSLLFAGAVPSLGRMPMETAFRGIFVHKNVLGWYAAISALVSGVMVTDRAFGPRRRGVLLLVLSLVCLAGSTSMTGILSTVAALGLAWFYRALTRARGVGRAVLVLLFVQGVALALLALDQFLVPVLEALGKDATLTGRVPLWRLVDQQIASRLLLGFGYQAFWTKANLAAWKIWSALRWMAPHAHNGYRDTLLSFGIVGFAVFIVAVARALRDGARLQCRQPQEGWLWLNVLMGAFLVTNLTESMFLVPNETLFILFATAMISVSSHARQLARQPARPGAGAWDARAAAYARPP